VRLAPVTAMRDWERLWAPYDEPTYQAVLAHVRPDDVVLEIGAGDLRLARRLAKRARRVHALEVQPNLIARALAEMDNVPDNLQVVCGDARHLAFPKGVTLGVLLMRHCRHFRLYADKLAAIACPRLITNARWRLGVEVINLLSPRISFDEVPMGWYACWCGATGFIPGPPERLTPELEATVHQVTQCPTCRQ
jgi:SAM-dependent methyltransferase